MSLGVPVQVICRAQSTNLTARPTPKPLVSTPVTGLAGSINQTFSVNQTAAITATQTATISANQTATFSVNQTAAFTATQTATMGATQTAALSASRTSEVGGKEGQPTIDETGLQYQFKTSAGDTCGLTCKLRAYSFGKILPILIPVQE